MGRVHPGLNDLEGDLCWTGSVSATTSGESSTAYEATATGSGIAALPVGMRGGYCQSLFEALARSSPAELIDIVRENRAPDTRLTFAAEVLGRDVPTSAAANALLRSFGSIAPLWSGREPCQGSPITSTESPCAGRCVRSPKAIPVLV